MLSLSWDQGFLTITALHFKDSCGHCSFTKDELFEIAHTHITDENHQVVVMKKASGLTQVHAEGPHPAKICFKILEEMSAILSGWCHIKTASILSFYTQPQNQPDHFPEIKLARVSPAGYGFSHLAIWCTTLLSLHSPVLSHSSVPTAGHTRMPTESTLSLARTVLYNQYRGFVPHHIQRQKCNLRAAAPMFFAVFSMFPYKKSWTALTTWSCDRTGLL